MPGGVRLAVDVGSVRVGVARSDPDGVLALPVATLARDDSSDRRDQHAIAELCAAQPTAYVVVGLPTSLSGRPGPAAERAVEYARELAALVKPVPVRLVDERLTTVKARQALRDTGMREREHRAVVDQAAAVVLLQSALDRERATGELPGTSAAGGRRKPRAKGRGS